KLLCEHAVRFDDDGIAEIKRVADERRQFLAKRAKFIRNGSAGSPSPQSGGGASLRRTNGPGRDESVMDPAQRSSSEKPRPPSMGTPEPSPLSSLEEPPERAVRS